MHRTAGAWRRDDFSFQAYVPKNSARLCRDDARSVGVAVRHERCGEQSGDDGTEDQRVREVRQHRDSGIPENWHRDISSGGRTDEDASHQPECDRLHPYLNWCRAVHRSLVSLRSVSTSLSSSLSKIRPERAPASLPTRRRQCVHSFFTAAPGLDPQQMPRSSGLMMTHFSDRLANCVLREAHASWPRITMSRDELRCFQLVPCRGAHTQARSPSFSKPIPVASDVLGRAGGLYLLHSLA